MKYLFRFLSILLLAGILLFAPSHSAAAAGTDDLVFSVMGDAFMVQTHAEESYNYNVDCDNDGTVEATALTGDYLCEYGESGTHTIRVSDNNGDGTGFPRFAVAFCPSDILQWGTGQWTSMASAFYNCVNLQISASDTPDLSGVTSMSHMFDRAWSFNTDISGWDVSNVTDMSYLFSATYGFNQYLSAWDTASVTNMEGMFASLGSFNQPLGDWDTSSVTNMSAMFLDALFFDQDLSGWDVSSVTTMENMFGYIALSTANYDALLNSWNAQPLQNGVTFDGGTSTYCLGETARQNMINSDSWTITDGGLDCGSTKPTMVSPTNKALVAERTIFFTWEPIPTMTRYTLEVKQVSDNSVVYKAFYDASVRCDATSCSVPLSIDFEPGVKYKWHVIPWDSSNTRGAVSSWYVFTKKLTTPELRSPGDGSIMTGSRPTFKWYPVYTSNEYVIELLDEGGTRVGIWSWKDPICTTYCEFRLPPAYDLGSNYGDYQWRVRARNDERASDWSGIYTFTYE